MTWEDSWKAAYPYIANKSTGIKLGDYEDAMRKFYKAYGSATPPPQLNWDRYDSHKIEQGYTPTAEDYAQNEAYDAWQKGQSEAFFGQLTPQQKAEYFAQKDAKYKSQQRMGQMAFLAAAGAMAAPGILGAMGSMSGAPASAAAAGGDLGMAGWMGSGAGAMGTEAGAAGLLGSGTGAGAMGGEYLGPLLDSLSSAGASGGGWAGGMPAGVDLGALGGIMPTGGGGGMLEAFQKYLPEIQKLLGGQSGGQQGNQQGPSFGNMLGMGGLGLLSQYYNNSKMPGVPNFMDLAMKTGVSANPNQTNAQGDTLNWAVDPVTGQRTQTVKYGAGNQKAFDEQQAMAQALRSKIMSRPASPPPMQQVDLSNLWG